MTMRNMATRPRVTFALIAINVIVFLGERASSRSSESLHGSVYRRRRPVRQHLGCRPWVSPTDQWWRLLTSGFLHENLLHIGFNMYLLYCSARCSSRRSGSVRFAAIYFTSLLAGLLRRPVRSPRTQPGRFGCDLRADGGRRDGDAVRVRSRSCESGIGDADRASTWSSASRCPASLSAVTSAA